MQWERVIARHPRYRALLELQGRAREPEQVETALSRFTPADYRDLQVWFNLAWLDPDTRAADPALRALENRGSGFSEADRALVIERQLDQLRRVVPVHRRLYEKGQIELITTPFYHPILPLLIDSQSALRASPGLPLPPRFSYPEDACRQVSMAADQFARLFGDRPKGSGPRNRPSARS